MISIEDIVETVNKTLPLNSMWDGLWVHKFKRKNLVIGASFDRCYYRDYDIVFKKVSFFNLPYQWRDTEVNSENLIRLSTKKEFEKQHPDFDILDKNIFAIDIWLTNYARENIMHTFFVIAQTVYIFKQLPPDNNFGGAEYTDPFIGEVFPCKKNRVTK